MSLYDKTTPSLSRTGGKSPQAGWLYVLRQGKHISMTDEKHLIIIPRQHIIKPGTLKQILEAAEISPERFKELL